MGFLDNLEDNLKSMESRDERDPRENARRREAERASSAAVQPWADQLKASPFTQALLEHATLAGHQQRAKVYIAWIGKNLRLDLREHRLELRPTPEGITAVYAVGGEERRTEPVDLNSDPAALVARWLESM